MNVGDETRLSKESCLSLQLASAETSGDRILQPPPSQQRGGRHGPYLPPNKDPLPALYPSAPLEDEMVVSLCFPSLTEAALGKSISGSKTPPADSCDYFPAEARC